MAWIMSLFLSTTLLHGAVSQAIDCANPADIMFLLDGSDSIDAREWDQARNFVARMVAALDISPATINVGFTVYSSAIASHHSVYPFKFKIVLTGMARSLQHPTGIATNTALGIQKIRETFRQQPISRRNAPKIMIVITDGSSENPAETINQAKLAKAEGIRIIAVGVGNNVFVEELQQIASNQRKYYQAADFTALQAIESDIRNLICRVITTTKAPSVTFSPPTPPPTIPLTGNRICNVPGDIVFVIDGSDSISDADYIRLKNFVASLIGNFEIGPDAIHVGMLVYSTTIGDTHGLFPPKQKLILQALARNLKHPRFGTDTALGIQEARNMVRDQGRPSAPEIIVVITDGRSSNPRNTIIEANLAKASGITMIAIGVGTAIFSEELNQIATGPNYVSEVADFMALENTVNLMRNLICTSITTTTTTTTSLPPTMPPYIEPPADGLICKVPGDVIFLLDGSDSIRPNDWVRQKNFVANLINNLEVGPQYIHVSVVVYSSQIGQEVLLQPFKPKPILNGLVKNLNQPRFGTDTALGIERARELHRTQGRPNAPKVIIVVTDGKSTFPDTTLLQANMAKADGITMISVGVGTDVFPDELRNIATSDRKTFQVIDFTALKDIIGTLRDLICRLVQTTTIAPVTTTTQAPTTTPMPTPMPVPLYPCGESYTAADLVFLMDGSKSLTPYNWMMSTHFMSNLLDGLQLTNEHMHAGVVISDTVRGDSIGITPFKTRFHLKELMNGLMKPSGTMDTATGIRNVIDIFNQQGRRNAQKLVIFLTDDGSKSALETSQAARRLKEMGTDVVAVGIGNNVNVGELRNIASNPNYVLQTYDYNQMQGLLTKLQTVVCDILRKPTTPAPTPPTVPSLCEGCLIDAGVGFNPYPGDCTKFVQCWKEGDAIQYLIRSCPFGQFWDADAITCRPSFLVRCTADPCNQSPLGYTYGMVEYGCRAYWKCIDNFSVGHCCPRGSAYVEGMGCLERPGCNQECPPSGGIAMQEICDKKAHWDKRYYIEMVYGRGEVVRPCPAGTIFFADKCTCDYGMSALLPESHVMCKPAAFFPFDINLQDQSLNKINVGLTNVQRTDLGTASFDGRSEMNLWRFAGTDWGPTLVIKFKFRFDHSNKVIDYGGLPVDLGMNFDMSMNLISDFQMTDADWRLWTQLNNVRTLTDWQQLLREFGQSRTFYIFLGSLGFKPGTFNSEQVVRILSTPEAFSEFRTLLGKLQQQMTTNLDFRTRPTEGLRTILAKLRNYHGLVNWDMIIRKLRGDSYVSANSTGGAGSQTTTINGGGQGQMPGPGNWRYDTKTQQWIRIGGTGSGMGSGSMTGGGMGSGSVTNINMTMGGGFDSSSLNMGGANIASEWRLNAKTGKWERLASVDGGAGASGSDVTITNTQWIPGSGANSWSSQKTTGGKSGSMSWKYETSGAASGSAAAGGASSMGGTSNMGGTSSMGGASNVGRTSSMGVNMAGTGNMGAVNGMGGGSSSSGSFISVGTSGSGTSNIGGANVAGSSNMGGFNGVGGVNGIGGVTGLGGAGNAGMGGSGSSGSFVSFETSGSSNMGGVNGVGGGVNGLGGVTGLGGAGNAGVGGSGSSGSFVSFETSGSSNMGGVNGVGGGVNGLGGVTGLGGAGNAGVGGSGSSGSFVSIGASGSNNMGGANGVGGGGFNTMAGVNNMGGANNLGGSLAWQEIVRQFQQQNGTMTGNDANRAAVMALFKQIQEMQAQGQGQGSTQQGGPNGQWSSWEWSNTGGTATGNQLDTKKLDGILKQIQEAAMAKSMGGAAAGTNMGGSSKRTVQTVMDTSQPLNNGISGGRVVGGTFGQFSQSASSGGGNVGDMKPPGTSFGESFSVSQSGSGGMSSSQGSSGGQGMTSGQYMQTSGMTGQGLAGGQASGQFGQMSGGASSTGGSGSFGQTVAMGTNTGTGGQFGRTQGATGGQFGRTQGGNGGQFGRIDISDASVIKQTVKGESKPGIPNRSALRGAQARGVKMDRPEGSIIGLTVPEQGNFISGATVIGKGEGTVRVSKSQPQIRITNAIRETSPVLMDASMAGGSGFTASGGAGSWSAPGFQQSGGASGSSQFVSRETVSQGGGGMAGGDFTQFGNVAGSGGGVKRVVDTHVKRIPGGAVSFDATGGVDLASLGLGGAEGANIIRQTLQMNPGSGQFIDANTLNSGVSSGQGFGSMTSSSSGTQQTLKNRVGMGGLGGQVNQGYFPFFTPDAVDTLLDGFAGKKRRKRSTRSSRKKRATNKQAYQALVTNCQGQGGQGPSIMVVANQGDVQFALKTYGAKDPGIVSVPVVDGWNDVTLIYDGKQLTGVVENWKGVFKSAVSLSGSIERRQAGLLVGSCQGYASFHGEIDDLTVYKCLTPDIAKLRDQNVVGQGIPSVLQ